MKTSLWMILAVALGAFTVGCGSSYTCKDFCEAENGCADTTTPADCDQVCANLDKLNDAADCGSSWDSVMDCASKNEDKLCDMMTNTDSTVCTSEALGWFGCALEYCSTHTDDSACGGLTELP